METRIGLELTDRVEVVDAKFFTAFLTSPKAWSGGNELEGFMYEVTRTF